MILYFVKSIDNQVLDLQERLNQAEKLLKFRENEIEAVKKELETNNQQNKFNLNKYTYIKYILNL